MCLDVAHRARVDTCVRVRGAQDGLLSTGVRSHQAVGPAVLVDGAAPDRRVDAVPVGQSPAQRLEHDHARTLAPYIPVGARVERLATPVRGHRTGLTEVDGDCWRQDDVHASRDRHGAVPLLQAPARLVDGDQRGGARAVDRHAGSAQVEQIGQAVRGDAQSVPRTGEGIDLRQVVESQVRVVAGRDADEHAGRRAGELLSANTGVLHRLPGDLRQQSLLRIHLGCLARRNAEELWIKRVDLLQEATPPGAGLAGRRRVLVEEVLDGPPVAGDLADGIAPLLQKLPEAARVVCAAREAAADANDGHRLVSQHLVRGAARGQRGRDGGRGDGRTGRSGRRPQVGGRLVDRGELPRQGGWDGSAQPELEIADDADHVQRPEAEGHEGRLRVDLVDRQPCARGHLGHQPLAHRGCCRARVVEGCAARLLPSERDGPFISGVRVRSTVCWIGSGRDAPGVQRVQVSGEEHLAACGSLKLAARRLRDPATTQQDDVVDLQVVIRGNGFAHGGNDLLGLGCRGRTEHLVGDDEALLAVDGHGAGDAAARSQRRVAPLHRALEVLGVVVAPGDDDQILASAGDEKLPALKEAEVTGAQVARAVPVGQGCVERRLGRRRRSPVAGRNARPVQPDLSDHAVVDDRLAVRVHHEDLVPGYASTRAHQGPRRRTATNRRAGLLGAHARVEGADDRCAGAIGAGCDERALGKPVAREEGFASEAVGSEGLGEALERLLANGLRSVEGDAPSAQVQIGVELGSEFLRAQVVGEIRSAADGCPVRRDESQPPVGALEEGHRRHHRHGERGVRRLQQSADESHVVVRGQPHDHVAAGLVLGSEEAIVRGLEVVHEVGVRHHHALGLARRAGGVLKEGDVVGRERRALPPVSSIVGDRVHFQPGESAQGLGELGEPRCDGDDRGGGEHDGGLCVFDHAGQPRKGTLEVGRLGRIHRDGYHPGVEAAEEGRDVVEPRRADDEGAVARRNPSAQLHRDRASATVELAVGHQGRLVVCPVVVAVRDRLRVREKHLPEVIGRRRRGAVRRRMTEDGPPLRPLLHSRPFR